MFEVRIRNITRSQFSSEQQPQQQQQQQQLLLWWRLSPSGGFCFQSSQKRAAVVPSLDIVLMEVNAPSSPGWVRWAAPVLLDIKEQGARGRPLLPFTLPPSIDQTPSVSLELSILTILASKRETEESPFYNFCSWCLVRLIHSEETPKHYVYFVDKIFLLETVWYIFTVVNSKCDILVLWSSYCT